MSSFCRAKATHIFSAKNIRILYIESAKTVNEMTLNKLVKLTSFEQLGPAVLAKRVVNVNLCHLFIIIFSYILIYFFIFTGKKRNKENHAKKKKIIINEKKKNLIMLLITAPSSNSSEIINI